MSSGALVLYASPADGEREMSGELGLRCLAVARLGVSQAVGLDLAVGLSRLERFDGRGAGLDELVNRIAGAGGGEGYFHGAQPPQRVYRTVNMARRKGNPRTDFPLDPNARQIEAGVVGGGASAIITRRGGP